MSAMDTDSTPPVSDDTQVQDMVVEKEAPDAVSAEIAAENAIEEAPTAVDEAQVAIQQVQQVQEVPAATQESAQPDDKVADAVGSPEVASVAAADTPTATSNTDAVSTSTPLSATPTPPPRSKTESPLDKDTYDNSPGSWQIPIAPVKPPAAPSSTSSSNQPYEPTAAFIDKHSQRRERLEQRLSANEEDIDAWESLLSDASQTGDVPAIRDVYERLLKVFPTSAKHWIGYLEMELGYSNFTEAEALFTRCLKSVLSVDLWKFYLSYIQRINGGNDLSEEARTVIEKAFEYVLNHVGIDKDAGSIWVDYLYFLRSTETSGTWEEQRKMDNMRRTYQRAISIPLNNVEQLWKDYDQWENNLNRLTAKKFLSERSTAYMTARTALRESRSMTDALLKKSLARKPRGTDSEAKQLSLWKKYIAWEKGNPLHLEESAGVVERVSFAYQQALLVFRHFPELWYDYAMYFMQQGKPDRSMTILKQATDVLPMSLVITFAYAELCEANDKMDDVKVAYDALLERLDQQAIKAQKDAQDQVDQLQQELTQEISDMNLGDDVDGELREKVRARERQVKREQEDIQLQGKKRVEDISRQCTMIWIAYMRMERRVEGIKAARGIFSRARKSPYRTFHVFIASALMEYHNSKDAVVAGKIFGLAAKSFGDDPDFVCQYLDFLIQMNDDNNTRALFERSLATLAADKATPVWKKFLDYENKYGDLTSVKNVEKRMLAAIPSMNSTDSFMARYSYLDLNPKVELDAPGRQVKRTSDRQQKKQKQPQDEEMEEPPKSSIHDGGKRGKGKPQGDLGDSHAPSKKPQPQQQAPPQPQQPPQASNGLPSMVGYILSRLPAAPIYHGPIISPGELLDVLCNLPLAQNAPPPPVAHRKGGQGGPAPSRDPRMRGRGDGKRGGRGGGRGAKRKGGHRDDADDDYGGHHKGMGPNRPPEYDVFRARQAKRHRDDPSFT
ncbi:hypothetical protein BC940DRAFT_293627 [Gongronella butleri]|nr:hypothetical protein BC940DRAFT_293627 [Gongronella butleri]